MVDYAPPRSVAQLARVPQAVRLMLGVYLLNVPDIRSFSTEDDPVLAYFTAVVGPYALLIDKALPGRARESSDVPTETKVFLLPHVMNFVKFLVLAYVVAQRVSDDRGSPLSFPPESCATLGLARKFHALLDQPSYEFPEGLEPDILLLLNFMAEFADRAATGTPRPRDVPEIRGLEHIPCVPSWTTEDIRILQAQETCMPWVGESYWLADRTQALLRVGRDLERALNCPEHAAWYPPSPKDVDGIAPSPPFLALQARPALGSPNDCFTLLEPLFPRYMTIPALKVANVYLSHFRPSVEPTGESRIVQRLDSLWSSHIRGLAQAIHEILHGRDAALLPPELLGILRISVQVLISNMVVLGATRVNAGDSLDPISSYHIPPFATMCFFMVEKFVNLVGFIGDDDEISRNDLFSTMDIFLHAMVTRSDYSSAPVDAPGYESASADPFEYGVGHHTKSLQAHEVRSSGRLAHHFGRALSRYEPELGASGYRFPVCPTQFRIVRPAADRFGPGTGPAAYWPMSFYTIDDAVPDLSQLSLSKRQLLSDYIMPEQGVPAFFRETLRPFVHLLLRAATRNFSHRLVVRSVSHRAASLARGELTWATTDFHIPGEAFHMLRISAYLCQFVGYTTGRDFVVSLRPDILIPLLEAAGSDIHWAGAKGEYPEHDPYESLCYADLLLHPDSTRALLNVSGSGGSPLSGLIEPLFPPRNYSGALPPPIVPIPNDELDRIVSSMARYH
ncbi:hypothetical protein C8R47DRAFT_1085150 [Mycena vitilis]|nr:hypothetical protein C8R47DRAFT_1085150 [Mycena vitilis]